MAAEARLTPSDWATIVTLYQRGEKNLRQLGEQFNVSSEAIRKGLKSRGIEKGSRLDEVVDEAGASARKAREAKVANAMKAVEEFAQWNSVIAKLVMKRVLAGEKDGNLATKNADVLVLKNAAAVIEKARSENWDILGVKDLLGENAELPDLNVGEYTPEELEAIREANEASYMESIDDSEREDDDVDAPE